LLNQHSGIGQVIGSRVNWISEATPDIGASSDPDQHSAIASQNYSSKVMDNMKNTF